jgi:hypothetical protein
VWSAISHRWLIFVCAATTFCVTAKAQPAPVLIWMTNSSVKLEQINGDIDWEAQAQGSNLLTASQTVTRFHILGNGLGYSFEDNGKLIFLFGDTISENASATNYHAADPLAWSTNTDGETPLRLNFFTNNIMANSPGTNKNGVFTNFLPIFVQPAGLKMGPDDVPNSGISLSNGVFLICNTRSDLTNTNIPPQTNDESVLVTFNETNLPLSSTASFTTNRVVSMLNSNLDGKSPLQGRFINVSLHESGTNVMMFGTGEYRSGDVFLCMMPAAHFVSGTGTLYFTGLTNGQPTWSSAESNCVPVVQDNPTNGPAWPNDAGSVGNVSVTYPPTLGLWLMTYDGGRSPNSKTNRTTGIYFSFAQQPWGPWSAPQLIFNKFRDGADGVFIHDPGLTNDDGLDGPTIGDNDPTNTFGGEFAPIMIERFTRITNSTLFIYYTLSTWNPYAVVKMRSAFTIAPVIDPGSLVHKRNRFNFSWSAPTNGSYQVDYSSNMLSGWTTFSNIITSTNGTFDFTNIETGGLPPAEFYRLRTSP